MSAPSSTLFVSEPAWLLPSGLTLVLLMAAGLVLLLELNRRVRARERRAQTQLDRLERLQGDLRRLAAAIEQTTDAVLITDAVGRIQYVNRGYEAMTGYLRAEVIGESPHVVKSGLHDPAFYQQMWETLRAGEAFRGIFINRRKDGSLYYEEKTIAPIKDDAGAIVAFVSTGKDISERRRVEEQARQHEARLARISRLSTIGEMSTALAHELNQPLAAIANYANGSLRRLQGGTVDAEQLRPALDAIAQLTDEAGRTIRRMRDFARERDAQRRPTDINRVVRAATELAAAAARHTSVGLCFELADALPHVVADDLQLQQVVLNLVRNAIEAMERAESPRREVIISSRLTDDGQVEVSVSDTGPGLAQGAQALLDRFFVPREGSEGLGMGLAISRTIVEDHGGHLRARNTTEGGAVFSFVLPAGDRRGVPRAADGGV